MLKVNHKIDIIITKNMLKQFVETERLMITKKVFHIYYIFSTKSLSLNHIIGDSLFLGEYFVTSEKELLDIDQEIQEKIKVVYEKMFNNSIDIQDTTIESYHNYDYYKFYSKHLTDYILNYVILFFKYDDFKQYLPDLLKLLNSDLHPDAKNQLIQFNLLQLESPEYTNSNLYKNNLLFLYKRDPEAYFNYLSQHNTNEYLGISLSDLNHKDDLIRTIDIISIKNIKNVFYRGLFPISFYPFLTENERQQYFGKQYFNFNKDLEVLDSDLMHLDYLINNKMYLFDINDFIANILDTILPKEQGQRFKLLYDEFDEKSTFSYPFNDFIYENLMHFEELLEFCVQKNVQIDIKKHTLDNIHYNLMNLSFNCQEFMLKSIKNYIDELQEHLNELFNNDNFNIIDKSNYDVSVSTMHSINLLF